ncbi:polysaccharide pyruvyl transferase family protein [Ferruginivarius sediminum]|uniref:Polysaccharide pyruvyl transferase family protein n=1 Tax=Ferruginivarius sediminum TaxID=2661937 RepID=A0A369TAD3_9PROT|nr:polysaccharide pyruvyl transferase family protein [Ferruginivarius sediminum]RDD62289.1 polysaccharide pyruvyl transferase family protein [Ferruginivarius sediminum]
MNTRPGLSDTEPAPCLRIGLLWHSVNSPNLGVGALTISNIAIMEKVANELGVSVEFIVLGWMDKSFPVYVQAPNVRALALNGRACKPGGAFSAAVGDCDLVLDIGAGDSFADIYGWRRFLYLAYTKWLVKRAGRPLVLSPQTLGPFKNRLARAIAAFLIRRSDLVFARDRMSVDYARDIGVSRKIIETTDVAFRLPYEKPSPWPGPKEKTVVGINISALLYQGGYTRDNMFQLSIDFPALMDRLLDYFAGIPDCEVVLVPHVLSHRAVEDDLSVCQQVQRAHPGVSVAPAFRSPSEAKSFIAGLDFFIGARMHACIAALSTGVPVAPLAYSRKFMGLFYALDYRDVIDCAAETTESALEAVTLAFGRRDELARMARHSAALAQDRLGIYEDGIKDFLASRIPNRRPAPVAAKSRLSA